jgi:nucleoid-associated protein YgaU
VNRENKLAIIIGFSLVLVVAVLISDHFSRARTAQISAEIKPGTPEEFGAGTAGLTEPIGGSGTIPAHTSPLAGELTNSRTRTVSDPGPAGHAPDEVKMGVDDGYREPTETSDDVASRDEGRSSIPDKPFSKGAMKTHEVKDGDKMYRIAEKYYGDGTLWKSLADYNKDRVPNAGALRVGVTLRIPPKDVLMGEAQIAPEGQKPTPINGREGTGGRPGTTKESKPADRSIAGTPTKNDSKSSKTYKVARGDSLGTIAQKLLGSSRRASELYQLNKDVLEDEHSVVAGMVLKVPAR